MQKVSVLCVGKLKEKFYAEAAAEYAKRLTRFCRLEILELPEERLPEDPSPAQIAAALEKEAAAIRAKLPSSAFVIALCVEGKLRSSEDLARMMAESAGRGQSHVVFIIGGSFGLDPSIKALAAERLYPRVLPTLAGITACEAAGIPHRNILAMQGPFTQELNAALLRQFRISYMVTKDGGVAGGFAEKAEAAAQCGVQLIVLRRPEEQGESAETILQRCREIL